MPDPVPAIAGLVLLLALSGFFSGSETALIAVSRYRLGYLANRGDRRAAAVRSLVSDPERLLSTILVGNNFANIAASALATMIAIRLAGEEGAIYATVVMTLLILVFSDIAPKTLAARHPERVSFWVAPPIGLLVKLLHPIASAAVAVANVALWFFGNPPSGSTVVSEEEIKGMIFLGEDELAIAREKRLMLHGVFRLSDLTVEDVMIPRTKVVAIDIDASPRQIIDVIRRSGYTRFPVCRGTLDDIVGVLNSKDVFKYLERLDDLQLAQLTRQPLFVPESATLQPTLQAFREHRQHLAVVIDEYGGVEGIVSLEDLLEEIVGEIDDAFDLPQVPQVIELDGGDLRAAGSCPLEFLNQRYGLELKATESHTLAGLILEISGRIPATGERISYKNLELLIERAVPNRIDQVRIEQAVAKP